jgi:hypothetical protein
MWYPKGLHEKIGRSLSPGLGLNTYSYGSISGDLVNKTCPMPMCSLCWSGWKKKGKKILALIATDITVNLKKSKFLKCQKYETLDNWKKANP